jgi:RND superfamily putative drug exporter
VTTDSPRHARSGGSRLARLVCGRRSKYLVLALWVVILAATWPLSGRLHAAESNDPSAYLPASAEATRELTAQSRFISSNLNPAVVVYVRPSGITAADRGKAAADAREFATLRHVGGRVTRPELSADGRAIQVTIGAVLNGNDNFPGFVSHVRSIASRGDPGVAVRIAGPAAATADQDQVFNQIDSTLLQVTVAIIVLLLLLTYRSPVAWLLPIISAGASLIAAQGVIYLLTKEGLTVNGLSAGILLVLVLGASTDYALLITARYREELRRCEDRHEAMAIALQRSGHAIIASAGTVIAGMLCLLAAESADISGLGPVAAIGIAVGLLAMLTLLPALLVTVGRWIFWPVRPAYGSADRTARGLWASTAQAIARAPRGIWIVTAVLLACAWLGLAGFKIGTLTSAQSYRGTPASVAGEQTLARYFPAGAGEPVAVVGTAARAGELRGRLASVRGISAVQPPKVKGGLVFLEGTLTSKPDSAAAYATIDRVRAALHKIPGADARVGGTTATSLDVSRASTRDRNLIIPLVLVVVLVILAALLRAIIAPLVLIATVVLSFGAALGLSALIFTHLLGFAGADTSMPLYAFVFLVALGIDYNIFLMTRVREEAAGSGTRRGAITGLAATGGVITSAGLVLAGTFAALSTLPLVILTEVGITVALGVLLDAIVVRSILVTALTLDIGRRIWWPSGLGRASPQEVSAQTARQEAAAVR